MALGMFMLGLFSGLVRTLDCWKNLVRDREGGLPRDFFREMGSEVRGTNREGAIEHAEEEGKATAAVSRGILPSCPYRGG